MKKSFGNNITPNCEYCELAQYSGGKFICTKNKVLVNNKCRKFKYDPLKRVPNSTPSLDKYSLEDFVL